MRGRAHGNEKSRLKPNSAAISVDTMATNSNRGDGRAGVHRLQELNLRMGSERSETSVARMCPFDRTPSCPRSKRASAVLARAPGTRGQPRQPLPAPPRSGNSARAGSTALAPGRAPRESRARSGRRPQALPAPTPAHTPGAALRRSARLLPDQERVEPVPGSRARCSVDGSAREGRRYEQTSHSPSRKSERSLFDILES
jgi:hypothetical protein